MNYQKIISPLFVIAFSDLKIHMKHMHMNIYLNIYENMHEVNEFKMTGFVLDHANFVLDHANDNYNITLYLPILLCLPISASGTVQTAIGLYIGRYLSHEYQDSVSSIADIWQMNKSIGDVTELDLCLCVLSINQCCYFSTITCFQHVNLIVSK